jgi:hypothetical protein
LTTQPISTPHSSTPPAYLDEHSKTGGAKELDPVTSITSTPQMLQSRCSIRWRGSAGS